MPKTIETRCRHGPHGSMQARHGCMMACSNTLIIRNPSFFTCSTYLNTSILRNSVGVKVWYIYCSKNKKKSGKYVAVKTKKRCRDGVTYV